MYYFVTCFFFLFTMLWKAFHVVIYSSALFIHLLNPYCVPAAICATLEKQTKSVLVILTR